MKAHVLLLCMFPYCSSANLLGSGGFGAVYKATYRNKPVAVKILSEKAANINNTTPNYLLRLEVVCVCAYVCVCVCVCVSECECVCVCVCECVSVCVQV